MAQAFSLTPMFLSITCLKTRYQLLPADSIDAALIRRHNLAALATRDDDFDLVESIDVYKP